MNQSVIDMCASFVLLLPSLFQLDIPRMSRDSLTGTRDVTRLSRDSVYDQFVCRIWFTRVPLWALMTTSTYGILSTAIERYIAVVYPIWYNVRIAVVLYERTISIDQELAHAAI